MSSFIGQDQIEKENIKKIKIENIIYKHKELKPRKDGLKWDIQTHAGCLP